MAKPKAAKAAKATKPKSKPKAKAPKKAAKSTRAKGAPATGGDPGNVPAALPDVPAVTVDLSAKEPIDEAEEENGESLQTQTVVLEPDELPLVTLASEDELEVEPATVEAEADEEEGQRRSPVRGPPTAHEEHHAVHTSDWSLPEQFLTVALRDDWDDRDEKVKAGSQGAAIAASLLFELALDGRLRIHLDRLQVIEDPTGDAALDAFADEVDLQSHRKAQDALERLGRRISRSLGPWRERLHHRGVARAESWRFLGVFPRLRMVITDPEAKAKLENRLQRTLVGGTPDVRTILLLGLIDAAGLLPEIIPAGALAFNRKRINALLTGRDTLGYRVDPAIHDLQGALVAQILGDVRVLQGNQT